MATKGVEGSKSVLKAANDAGGDSLLFCVRKCDQKSLPQVKNYYTQSFSTASHLVGNAVSVGTNLLS